MSSWRLTEHGGMTKQQAAALEFIRDYIRENGGVSPSFDEIGEAVGVSSKSSVYRLITGLEQRGFLERLPGSPRSLRLTSAGMSPGRPPRDRAVQAFVEDLAEDLINDGWVGVQDEAELVDWLGSWVSQNGGAGHA